VVISESEFEARADEILEQLMETLEKTLGDELDVDLEDGILSIELDSGGQYVINKHRPNRQIWMSSPASGASHFDYSADSGWVATRGAENLVQILAQELSAATGRIVQFE
jgi:frataxin